MEATRHSASELVLLPSLTSERNVSPQLAEGAVTCLDELLCGWPTASVDPDGVLDVPRPTAPPLGAKRPRAAPGVGSPRHTIVASPLDASIRLAAASAASPLACKVL